MPQQKLDYQRPIHGGGVLSWYRTDLATAAAAVAIIAAANAWLVWNADKSWGFFVWVFVLIPLANALLAAVLLARTPLARLVSGMSASLHVWVTLLGCAAAVIVDGAIIFVQLRGC